MSDPGEMYKDHPVYRRITQPGPKRILSLDGGGIRGALSLGYLEAIETMLRRRYNNNSLVLSDYFDMIGGTSTGAILATLLSLGKEVEEIKQIYFGLGKKIFTKRQKFFNWWYFKYLLTSEYDHTYLEKELADYLGDKTLGSEDLKTALVIFAKRADTFSIWNFHNNPLASYYEKNKGIYLKDLLRASSAAPSFFTPKEIVFPDGEEAIFIDGGMSMANNPGLMLFLMSNISGYEYKWPSGANNIQLISIGTGSTYQKVEGKDKNKIKFRKTVFWAKELSDIFMIDANEQNQLLLQYFSEPHIPTELNDEARDLSNDLIGGNALLDYCRYNMSINQVDLAALGIHKTKAEVEDLRKMESGHNAQALYEIGKASAEKIVLENHFRAVFDGGLFDKKDKILSQQEAQEIFTPLIKEENKLYKNIIPVKARKVTSAEELSSAEDQGNVMTITADVGDYIIADQGTSNSLSVMSGAEFEQQYVEVGAIDDLWSTYNLKESVFAIKINIATLEKLSLPTQFHIIKSDGNPQYIINNDYIVMAQDQDEVYAIPRIDFEKTYKE